MSSVYSAASCDTNSPPSTATSFESPPPTYLTATTVRLLHAAALPQPTTPLRVTFQDSPVPRRGTQASDLAVSWSPVEPTSKTTHTSTSPSKLVSPPLVTPPAIKIRDLAISAPDTSRAPPAHPPPQVKPTDRLTSLPPELLLQILVHLPTSSSLLPLSQTSTYLQSFILCTHARSIVNSLITAHHSASAAILGAHVDESGWLVPTRRCVLEAEKKIVRERVRRSGCECVRCREILLESSSASGSDASPGLEGGLLNCLPPSASALLPNRRHAHTAIPAPFLLTHPGPLFLVFLERYEWELATRHAMLQAQPATAQHGSGSPQQREDEERRFDFVVGHWLVRRFLDDVERDFGSGSSGTASGSGSSDWEKSGFGYDAYKWEGSRDRAQKYISRVLGSVGYASAKMEDEGEVPEKLLFGEITPSLCSPPSSSRSLSPSPSGSTSWARGLLWYYGTPTPPPSLAGDSEQTQKPPRKRRFPFSLQYPFASEGEAQAQADAQVWSCIAGFSQGVRKAGRKVKMVLGARC
ncbi:hypothetical protein B2J93_2115 [Marssonina coronariae]|uniref:F-box domain-containing protein n=1 Tax=Diplocarpon coronariae TaxID=2795749 RepID=A0A218Z0M6_9HELO|nr:hypothetical protein B2J93_2115 [Marssonina coronariae]